MPMEVRVQGLKSEVQLEVSNTPSGLGWVWSQTTPHPSVVPVRIVDESGTKIVSVRVPTGLLKSWEGVKV